MTHITQRDDMTPRAADQRDLVPLAALWWEGWQDAHRTILPPQIAADRTPASLHDRLMQNIDAVRTVGDVGMPLGFSLIAGCELNQFYLSRAARGTGVAGSLIRDAEARLCATRARRAWLACAIGNDRAARFYEKHAWHRVGIETITLPLGSGAFDLAVWRYEKDLTAAAT